MYVSFEDASQVSRGKMEIIKGIENKIVDIDCEIQRLTELRHTTECDCAAMNCELSEYLESVSGDVINDIVGKYFYRKCDNGYDLFFVKSIIPSEKHIVELWKVGQNGEEDTYACKILVVDLIRYYVQA